LILHLGEHDPEKACPALDAGWEPVFRKDHAPTRDRIREHNMAENTQVDVKKLSFERAIEELESIVKRLEDGKVPLEESVAIYERGESLKRRCEELLRQAEARVDKITTDASGQVIGTEPLDVQ
jgi:exodeoxyribonuclease VII small subunit